MEQIQEVVLFLTGVCLKSDLISFYRDFEKKDAVLQVETFSKR